MLTYLICGVKPKGGLQTKADHDLELNFPWRSQCKAFALLLIDSLLYCNPGVSLTEEHLKLYLPIEIVRSIGENSEMPPKDKSLKAWQTQVQRIGFRETAITFLRDRLCREERKDWVDRLIRQLSKYDPQVEIMELLRMNPIWGARIAQLISEVPEVTLDPEVHFIFEARGNVPNIPALAENTLYFGCGQTLYALDAETGAILWQLQNPGKTWSIAWVSNDSLYTSSAGGLYAISPSDGSKRWCFEVSKELTSPCANGEKVFVGSENGTLYAVDAGRGSRLWTFNVAKAIFVAREFWQDKVFAASKDHSLYAISMDDGECLWHFTTGGEIYAPPYIHQGVIYLGSADDKIYALNATTGRLLWSFTTGGEVRTSPFEKDGTVYVSSRDRHLYVLRAQDGKELWRYKTLGYPSSPTATRGMVYFSTPGRLYGLNVTDHKMRWCFPVGSPIATSPVVCYKRIYTGTSGGRLICLKLKVQLEERAATLVLKQFMDTESQRP